MALAIPRRAFGLVLSISIGAAATAQGVTGVAGINDFTIGGSTPGAASCTFVGPLTAGTYNFVINTSPLASGAVLVINFNCPCSACFAPFPTTPCAVPVNSACPTFNQSLDLDPTSGFCTFIAVAMPPIDSAGNSTLSIPLPPTTRFSAQGGVVGHPCMTSGFPVMWTQAYNVSVL